MRKQGLDLMRILASCAVVLLHTVTAVMDTTDMTMYAEQKTVFIVIMDMVTWCVPVFLIISGYLFLNEEKRITFINMATKYVRRILLALVVFGYPYACIELYIKEGMFSLRMFVDAAVMVSTGRTWSHMWYLYMLLFLYLFTPLIKWIIERIHFVVLLIVMGILVIGSSIFPFINRLLLEEGKGMILPELPDWGIYLFFYLFGYVLWKWDKGRQGMISDGRGRMGRYTGRVAVAFAILLALGMAAGRLFAGYSMQMAYNYPLTVALSLLLMIGAINFQGNIKAPLCKMGELSFTVYLIHPVFINIAYKFLGLSLLDYPLAFSIPVFYAVMMICSILGAIILRRIPFMKKYIL